MSKLDHEYRRIQHFDVFVVRVAGCAATLWQRQPTGPIMVCRLPPKFCDGFITVQEWEVNDDNKEQCLRLDFLHRLSLPPSTQFETTPYFAKMRACLLGGLGLVSKDIQSFHMIDKVFGREEARGILNELNFYHRAPVDVIHQAFARLENPRVENSHVVVKELLDEVDAIPVAQLTAETVSQLHQLRHQRYRRRNQGNPYHLLF